MKIHDVARLTPAKYKALSETEKKKVHQLARKAHQELLDRAFQKPIDWVIIAGAPDKIFAKGTNAVKISKDQIEVAQRLLNRICYFYTRQDNAEEADRILKAMKKNIREVAQANAKMNQESSGRGEYTVLHLNVK